MKLLKRDEAELRQILTRLKRGQAFLMSQRVVVAIVEKHATSTEHLTNEAGLICYPITKDIGSELALLHSGIADLECLLNGAA